MKDRDVTPQKPKDEPRPTRGSPQPPESPKTRPPAEEIFSPKPDKCRLLIETSPLGIAVIESNGRYNYLNPKFREMFGYTLDDIPTGQEWFAKAFPDPVYRRQAISDWKLYLQESQADEAEPRIFRVTCKDGSVKVIKFRAVPLPEGEQFLLYEDITALREAEEALRESEGRLRLVQECAGDAFFVHDAGRILEVNQQACDSLGYSREELVGMSLFDFEIGISPEELTRAWQQSPPRPRTVQGIHKRKDGSTFPVEVKGSDFYYRGRRLSLGLVRDITERKLLENALQESEAHYRTLFETSPDAIALYDADLKLTMANQAAAALYGVERAEEMVGMSAFNFVAPESMALAQELAQESSSEENFIEAEFVLLKRDGTPYVAETRTVILRNADDSPQGFLTVAQDITERKRNEEKLLQAKEEWERTFDAIPDMVMILDKEYRIVRVNRSMAHKFGCEPEEMEGKICYRVIHGSEAPPSFCPCISALSLGQPIQLETWSQRLQSFLLITTSPVFDPSGNIVGSVQVGTDITERRLAEEALRESEERYRLIAENVSDVIWTTDLDLRYTYISPSVQQLQGFAPEEILGKTTGEFLHPASLEQALEIISEELAREEQGLADPHRSRMLEIELFHKNGHTVKTEVKARFLHDTHNHPIGILGITRDVTQRKEAEEALKESEEKLRSLSYQLLTAQEQERKRLATGLHNFLGHDLLLLKLKLESLQEQLGPEHRTQEKGLRQILRGLQNSVRNVRRLCQDLLPGDLEDLGLTAALHHLVENFAVTQRLKWQTELDDLHNLFEVPVQIAIYRTVQEALTNIGKHARAKHLWLQARRGGTEVSFTIEDDGRGFNVTEALAARKTLGLLAMEERIKILGGTFDIVSRKKEGTKISFTIPISKDGN